MQIKTVTPHAARPSSGRVALTSLEPLETIDPLLFLQTAAQFKLHKPYSAERMHVYGALATGELCDFAKQSTRLNHCCAFPIVYVGDDGKPSVHLARCRDRMCPLCSRARSRESGHRVHDICKKMDDPRFLTLTMPHSSDSLAAQLDRVMSTFRELRKTDAWCKYVTGGVWSLEVTYNVNKQEWHPHIHVLIDGDYFPQPEIKAEWSKIHRQECIVDVRRPGSRRDAARYIAKYVSKGVELTTWPWDVVREYAKAIKRRRTIHTFGHCHGMKAESDTDDQAPPKRTRTVGVWLLRRLVKLEHEEARRHVPALYNSGPVLRLLLAQDGWDPHAIAGDELVVALEAAGEWLRSLNAEQMACWRPQPVSETVHTMPSRAAPSLSDPPWQRPEPTRC